MVEVPLLPFRGDAPELEPPSGTDRRTSDHLACDFRSLNLATLIHRDRRRPMMAAVYSVSSCAFAVEIDPPPPVVVADVVVGVDDDAPTA